MSATPLSDAAPGRTGSRRTVLAIRLVALLGLACPVTANDQPAEAAGAARRALAVWLATPRAQRPALAGTDWASAPLSLEDAAQAAAALWQDHADHIRQTRAAELSARCIELDGLRMPFELVCFTNEPAPKGHALFIALHGGGNVPRAVNDAQWRNQIRLAQAYGLRQGLYLAPRAPTDAWDLWHQPRIDEFLARLIEDLVVLADVNPDRVYLLGYSAGADGVYQLAPRMADRWAAAATMAGHPNDASPLGLRNVPFAIHVGAEDHAFGRNRIAAEWGAMLDKLQREDPAGYTHVTEIHADKGHWMDLEERTAIPWMEGVARSPIPEKVVWVQDDVTHTRVYWLAVPESEARRGRKLVARRDGQTVTVAGSHGSRVCIRLDDRMLDLDAPVRVRAGDKTLFEGCLPRTVATLEKTLAESGDRSLMFSTEITVTVPPPTHGIETLR